MRYRLRPRDERLDVQVVRVEPPDGHAVDRLRHQDPLRVGAGEELRRHGAAARVGVPYFTDT